ncbi:MAG: short-chain dehydrogenase [Acidimicrobiaceae bacterium]|nr:short-chain dehydrogenase [Acidimicrobiaceae bacterium]MCH2626061.1 SDR family oxidoreductase [Acidimicrobiales bacterium]MEC8827609.1 SDR family oxidoreductase [Actinomycetota bacterium]MEC8923748.1 SDR family oxidoreductase [Actinomycetota bacterium]
MDLNGKVAVITGAASGIGRACAQSFAEAGAKVAVVDIDEAGAAEVAEAIGGIGVQCDLAEQTAISNMVSQVERELGPVEVLFNNAGIGSGAGLFNSSVVEWQRQWDVNLMSHVHAIHAVLPGMLDRSEGYLLHTASMAGVLSSHGNLPYAVSKHAVVGLAEWLAFTYAHLGIRVSLLAPLAVRTPMLGDAAGGEWASQAGGPIREPEEVAQQVLDAIAEERFLILTDPIAQTWMERKTADPDRWLRGMNRLQQRLEGVEDAGLPQQ